MKLEQTVLLWATVALVASFARTAARSLNVTEAVDTAFNVTTELPLTFEPVNVTTPDTITPPATTTTPDTANPTTAIPAAAHHLTNAIPDTTVLFNTIPVTSAPAATTTAATTTAALAHTTRSGSTLTLAPSVCTVLERRLIDSCLQVLAIRLQLSFWLLSSAGNTTACRHDLIRCQDVDGATRCLTALPKSLIRDACWLTLPQVMTENFKGRSIPCGYGDVARVCLNKHTHQPHTPQTKTTHHFSGNNMQSFLPAMLTMMAMQQIG